MVQSPEDAKRNQSEINRNIAVNLNAEQAQNNEPARCYKVAANEGRKFIIAKKL
jgi:hypothetical protein